MMGINKKVAVGLGIFAIIIIALTGAFSEIIKAFTGAMGFYGLIAGIFICIIIVLAFLGYEGRRR